jgi:hypothetical protein
MSDAELQNLRRAWNAAKEVGLAMTEAQAYLDARLRVEALPLRQLLASAVRIERLTNCARTYGGSRGQIPTQEAYAALTNPITDHEILLYLDGQLVSEDRAVSGNRIAVGPRRCAAPACQRQIDRTLTSRWCVAHKCTVLGCDEPARMPHVGGLCEGHSRVRPAQDRDGQAQFEAQVQFDREVQAQLAAMQQEAMRQETQQLAQQQLAQQQLQFEAQQLAQQQLAQQQLQFEAQRQTLQLKLCVVEGCGRQVDTGRSFCHVHFNAGGRA